MEINRKEVEKLKTQYPKGCRVRLIYMNDPYTDMTAGTEGSVLSVDDIGTIHVEWDNHHSLGVVYGEDKCVKID